MERAGFEPAKSETADLQSAGFDRSPTSPYIISIPYYTPIYPPNIIFYSNSYYAGTKIRTRDPLITNQLLYQLSYAGTLLSIKSGF